MSADHGSHSPPLPPEPETPVWFTVLGAVLFFALGVWWLATQPAAAASTDTTADAGAPPASASASAAPPPPAH